MDCVGDGDGLRQHFARLKKEEIRLHFNRLMAESSGLGLNLKPKST